MKDINKTDSQKLKFSEHEYLKSHPDVAIAIKNGQFKSGFDHYNLYGRKEGRCLQGAQPSSRREKALLGLNIEGLGLEIGPSHNPIAPKKDGYNIHILDHLDADGLKNKYKDHAALGVVVENIEEVDFVWSGEPISELIGKPNCYDYIIASHVIEHVPDLIGFFQQCNRLLKPDGKLSLIVPDKRYCFDYFSPMSSTGALVDAHLNNSKRPTPGQVFDHIANSSINGDKIAWSKGCEPDFKLQFPFDAAKAQYEMAKSEGNYIDTHCWRFIPESFSLIVSDLVGLGLSPLSIEYCSDSVGCEFFVTLSSNKVPLVDRLELLLKISKL